MRSAETEAVLELLEEAFGFRELFVRYLERDPALGPEDTLLAVAGERPVACVQIFTKRIRLRGQSVGLGGIGSVGTARDFRGRGLARRLVEAAAEEMRRRRMALALLFTGLVGFYEPLGFIRVPQRRQRLRGGSAASGSLASAERFIDADLPQIRELYEDYTATLEGCTLRDEDYWRGQLAYAGNPDEDFRVARRGGRIVAYVRTIPTEGPRVAMEFARASDGAEELSGGGEENEEV